MSIKQVLITGSCGLVGSETAKFFLKQGIKVTGIDNNQRRYWFGEEGSIAQTLYVLGGFSNYTHHELNVRDQIEIENVVKSSQPDLIIHCAAQPSHEKSAEVPLEDFMVNAVGTVNLLEASRRHCPETCFIHLSTNKVYGDRPNFIRLKETEDRFDFDDPNYVLGINEQMTIDQCLHSPFGASKASSDLMVQEYGKYYGMPTTCLRCGCITGIGQQGVEQHGFLNYLCRTANKQNKYIVYGHKGKQVRDIIHVTDLVSAFIEIANNPKSGEIYNMGGGWENSISILEAIEWVAELSGLTMTTEEGPPRKGDHICYYSNTQKFRSHYTNWTINKNIRDIFVELLCE